MTGNVAEERYWAELLRGGLNWVSLWITSKRTSSSIPQPNAAKDHRWVSNWSLPALSFSPSAQTEAAFQPTTVRLEQLETQGDNFATFFFFAIWFLNKCRMRQIFWAFCMPDISSERCCYLKWGKDKINWFNQFFMGVRKFLRTLYLSL